LFILRQAYGEFEERVGEIGSPKGEKTQLILRAIEAAVASFSLAEIEAACPGVSRDMVRKVLKDLQAQGAIECKGRGPGARWEKR
jgi:DNA-binding HxlR family transcriptional regulator